MTFRRAKKMLPLLGYFLLFPGLVACRQSASLKSDWATTLPHIDGDATDWAKKLHFFEKENFAVGIQNDNDYLYICFVSNDANLARRITRVGATLWIDSDGGTDKKSGIKFPLGFMQFAGQETPPSRESRPDMLAALELILPSTETPQRQRVDETTGLHVALSNGSEQFVYEIRIARNDKDAHFSLPQDAGPKIGVGFELNEIDRDAMREMMRQRGGGMRANGNRPRGGGAGRGNGMRGGGRNRQGNGKERQRPEPIKLWADIELASASK